RSEGRGDVGRRTGEKDSDLANQIEAGKLVEIFFRDFETVADEHHMPADVHGRARGARADKGISGEGERLGFTVQDEGERGFGFVHLKLSETQGLVEAVAPGGFETGLVELFDGVGLRFFEALAAGVAAFERIVGEKLDVRPPGVAVKVRDRRGRGGMAIRYRSLLGGRGESKHKKNSEKNNSTHAIHLITNMRIAGRERVTQRDKHSSRGVLLALPSGKIGPSHDTICPGRPFKLNGMREKSRRIRQNTVFLLNQAIAVFSDPLAPILSTRCTLQNERREIILGDFRGAAI